MKTIFIVLATLLPALVQAQPGKGKILVIISSENTLRLKDGKTFPTGYYLNELTVPAKKLVEAGYELVFANPKGNKPSMDIRSDDVHYFGDNQKEYQEIKSFHDHLDQLKAPLKLSAVLRSGLDQFQGVFVPGGHAPMIDLMASRELGTILIFFHQKAKPTALICHGPVALAAATEDPRTYQKALEKGDVANEKKAAGKWPYSGYRMTVFSTVEEKLASKSLGGDTLFFPEDILRTAGGQVEVGTEWKSNAIRDRELITGQNPFSDSRLAELFLEALNERK